MATVPFKIYNRNNELTFPMSGYSLPFEVFKFEADFTTTSNTISDKKVVWDFGDGTTSTDLTGYHSYNYPGLYPVTLTVFESDGDSTKSTVLSTIRIYNYINDVLLITLDAYPLQTSGQNNFKYYVTRYNSWQTSITGRNSVVLLSVSGNKSPFFTFEQYNSDKNTHFYPSSRFAIDTDLGLTTVNEVSTTSNFIYAKPNGDTITLSLSPASDNYIAGTSGQAYFYYIEDYNINVI